jgi:hypothetical protein
MKLLSIIVLALASVLAPASSSVPVQALTVLSTPTPDSCWKTLADRMNRIKELYDQGTITAKEATAMRRAAHKDYLKCLDGIPPTNPN